MRKKTGRLALVAFAAAAIVPLAAPSAQAWTCHIDDGGHLDPSPGEVVCDVFLKVTGPICNKYGCD